MTPVTPDPHARALERPVATNRLRAALDAAGTASSTADQVVALASRTPDPTDWRRFLSQALLVLGAGLVLSGVVTFVAFNWAALGHLAKFGLLAFAIAACAAGAWRQPDTLAARVLLTAASVLVGAFLAVIGQTYQTGADPWTLFAYWALLTFPWVIAARFAPLWLLWIVCVDVAYVLYLAQVGGDGPWRARLVLGVVGIHLLAVVAWEAQAFRREPWIRAVWATRVLAVAGLMLLLAPALLRVAWAGWDEPIGVISIVVLSFVIVAMNLYYRLVRPDTFLLTAAAGSVMAIVTTLIGRVLMVTLDLGILGLMLMTALILVEVVVVAGWLRRQWQEEAA